MKKQNEDWNGREVKQKLTFAKKGTFESVSAAEMWCEKNKWAVGSMQREAPRGMMKGDYDISKWRNLDPDEISALGGVMISDDFREGSVDILIF